MRYAYQSSYDFDYNCTTILTSPHHPFIYHLFHQPHSYQHPYPHQDSAVLNFIKISSFSNSLSSFFLSSSLLAHSLTQYLLLEPYLYLSSLLLSLFPQESAYSRFFLFFLLLFQCLLTLDYLLLLSLSLAFYSTRN